jgi:hypothetical protein
MLLLYPPSLFGHMLGSWLRHVDHPSDSLFRSLSFLSLIGSLLSFSTSLVPFFLLGVCDADPTRYRVELWEADGYDIR